MINPFLVGEQLYLRPLSIADVDGNYQSWLNDPELNQQNSHHVFPYTREDLMDYVKSSYTKRDRLPLAIVDRSNDRHVGNISLVNIDYINSRTDWGIIIGERDCWGKGFSRAAAILLLGHAFDTLNIRRIYSGTTAVNIGGQKLMESVGMIREGLRRAHLYRNGEYVDVVEYGMLREEFMRKFRPQAGS